MIGNFRYTKTVLLWGFVFVAVYMLGAAIDATNISGTCMFILMPYFAAFAVTYPILALGRFGTGFLIYLPYAVLGFFPLYYFDWLGSGALVGLWAVFLFSATGPLTGMFLDLTMLLAARLPVPYRAILLGVVMQALTFVTMLLGLTYLYVPSAAGVGHLHFFSREWFFTLPWMILNGAFGGYTAHALLSLRSERLQSQALDRKRSTA